MISLRQKSWITIKIIYCTNKFIKNRLNRFTFERLKDVCPLPGAGQNRPLPLLLPPKRSDWGWYPQWWSLPHMEKWQKLFLWWGLPHTCLLCQFMLFLGLNFLPQPLQANTWPLCFQILCWLGICKDLTALSQTLQGLTLSISCALSPHTEPIQQQHNFPCQPALDTCRSRC